MSSITQVLSQMGHLCAGSLDLRESATKRQIPVLWLVEGFWRGSVIVKGKCEFARLSAHIKHPWGQGRSTGTGSSRTARNLR